MPHTHPGARQHRRGGGPGVAPGVCSARVGRLATRSPAVSGAQGGEDRRAGLLLPQGRTTLWETETRDKIKRRHHKAHSACRSRPGDPQAGAETPGRWGARGHPSHTFSVHRQAVGRGLEQAEQRVSHLVIHYRGELSGPRAALSASQAFVIPTCVLVSLGATVAATTFWDANALCSSPMTDGEGEKRKERRKKTNTEGVNVQETPLHIQIPLGFHSGESLRWCLRRLTSHFWMGGGVGSGAGAGVHTPAPLCDRERCATGLAKLAAAAAPKRASRAGGPAEKRRC